jgi:DNA-binding winged helix-turn-helix (wHTH) protein
LVVDLGRACVTRDGQKIPVPRLSLDLLVVLLRAAPNVVSPEVLMQRVWPQIVVSPETVSQRVKLLRSALGDDPKQPRYLAAPRRRGFTFERRKCTRS